MYVMMEKISIAIRIQLIPGLRTEFFVFFFFMNELGLSYLRPTRSIYTWWGKKYARLFCSSTTFINNFVRDGITRKEPIESVLIRIICLRKIILQSKIVTLYRLYLLAIDMTRQLYLMLHIQSQ